MDVGHGVSEGLFQIQHPSSHGIVRPLPSQLRLPQQATCVLPLTVANTTNQYGPISNRSRAAAPPRARPTVWVRDSASWNIVLLRRASPQGSDQTVKPRPRGPQLEPWKHPFARFRSCWLTRTSVGLISNKISSQKRSNKRFKQCEWKLCELSCFCSIVERFSSNEYFWILFNDLAILVKDSPMTKTLLEIELFFLRANLKVMAAC
jgi:hypothetical protein